MRAITERQAQVLIFIENYIQHNHYSPTVMEVGAHFKITPRAAYDPVIALKNKGCITCEVGKCRTIRTAAKKQGAGL